MAAVELNRHLPKDGGKPWSKYPNNIKPETLLANKEGWLDRFKFLTSQDTLRGVVESTRAKFFKAASEHGANTFSGAVLLAGGRSEQWDFYDNDCGLVFRQESYFRYLVGPNEPDLHAVVDLKTKEVLLFAPVYPDSYLRFSGPPKTQAEFHTVFGIKELHAKENLDAVLKARGIDTLYVLDGENTDSGNKTCTKPDIAALKLSGYRVNDTWLHPVLSECRVTKTPQELDFMRAGNLVSSAAHVWVMKKVRPAILERHLEGYYKAFATTFGGAREVGYDCICACGPNSSILHYGHAGRPNDRTLNEGDMVLTDLGAEFEGYVTDITTSYPVSGKFSDKQAFVYDAVLAAVDAVQGSMKAGVCWVDMHRLAEKTILEHLKAGGIIVGDVAAAHETGLGAVFMPHGLGHLLGMNVHDVGGFNKGYARDKRLGPSYLRTTRHLEANMVITVEPGLYFVDFLLDRALGNPEQAQFLNKDKLNEFRGTGGVRLENDVVVHEHGCEVLTVVPRTRADVEQVMAHKE